MLFNLHKFLRFEGRDPFQEKQKREDSFHSDWDRFAFAEYHRLASEEEGYDTGTDNGITMDIDENMINEVVLSSNNNSNNYKYEEDHGNTNTNKYTNNNTTTSNTTNTSKTSSNYDWYLDDEEEKQSDYKKTTSKGTGSGGGKGRK